MFNVKVEKINGILVTTSNRVAEELGVQHRDLLKKIDNYLDKFNSPELSGQLKQSAKSFADFYIPSNYKDNRNRTYRNYLITKKGIAQLIGGYSAAVEKAFELNVAYINKFEEMEKLIYSNERLENSCQKKINYNYDFIPSYQDRVELTKRMVEKLVKEIEEEMKNIHNSLVNIKSCEAGIKLYLLQI